jgi:hypothetical protein
MIAVFIERTEFNEIVPLLNEVSSKIVNAKNVPKIVVW